MENNVLILNDNEVNLKIELVQGLLICKYMSSNVHMLNEQFCDENV